MTNEADVDMQPLYALLEDASGEICSDVELRNRIVDYFGGQSNIQQVAETWFASCVRSCGNMGIPILLDVQLISVLFQSATAIGYRFHEKEVAKVK